MRLGRVESGNEAGRVESGNETKPRKSMNS